MKGNFDWSTATKRFKIEGLGLAVLRALNETVDDGGRGRKFTILYYGKRYTIKVEPR